jgi:16S rRNA (uracil1498-N3)-methyltransferase
MSPPVFLVDAAALLADPVRVEGDEGRHAAVVRRIRVGETVRLTDGAGHAADCAVIDVDGHGLVCAVRGRVELPAPVPRFTAVQALAKGNRGELAVEMLTEVGIDVIVAWAAARSVVQWTPERARKGLARWRSVARESSKQARRVWLPEVRGPASTTQVCELIAEAGTAVVLHESGGRSVDDVPVGVTGDVVLVIGPEGGFTDDELAAFESAGAEAMRLGGTVLRTSTAGVVGAAVLLSRTARWS